MHRLTRLSLASLLLLAAYPWQPANAQGKQERKESSGGRNQEVVERGRYIVEALVHCERCHTPRDENGNPIRARWLHGGPLQLEPTFPAPNWAKVVPRIAGTPPGTDSEFITLMTTGIARTHLPPSPPMPQFAMTRADAEAVLAYLKSLP